MAATRANSACAVELEEPAAVSTRFTPASSLELIVHVLVNEPSRSALMNHASCPVPFSVVPPVCFTCSMTSSSGAKPLPEISIASLARYAVLSV